MIELSDYLISNETSARVGKMCKYLETLQPVREHLNIETPAPDWAVED